MHGARGYRFWSCIKPATHCFFIKSEIRRGFRAPFKYDHIIKVDFIVRKDTPYRQEEFARRIAVEIDGATMWLVTAEDLLLSKLVWAAESHSEMQLQDVRSLIRSVADLDWMYIERWANALTVGELLREVRG